MSINSFQIYIVILALATAVIAYAVVQWRIREEPGQKLFWRDLAIVFSFAFYIPATIFYFNNDLSLWWLCIPVIMLWYSTHKLLASLPKKSVPLERQTLNHTQNASESIFKIVHLSDLHLCAAPTTMEGNLPRDKVIETCRRALQWAIQQNPDLIAITGDVTDTGAAAEWELFESLLSELPGEWRAKVVFIPGNHDLSIAQSHAAADNDGNKLLEYEQRCAIFVRQYFTDMPAAGKLMAIRETIKDSGEFELNMFQAVVSKALEVYGSHPPRIRGSGEMLSALPGEFVDIFKQAGKRRNELPWRNDLSRYVPGIVFDDQYRATFSTEGLWPTTEYPLVQDLLHLLYPLVVYENERIVVIALNSNTIPSSWLADGALGEIGVTQAVRLELMLRQRPRDKVVVALVHHHIGCPQDVQPAVAKSKIELKALQLNDAWQLADIFQRHAAPCVVLHGHKHVGYFAQARGISVLSAASVPYGNKLGGANCNCVCIDKQGGVSLHASTTISCASIPNNVVTKSAKGLSEIPVS